jgi:hypothetical protein
VVSLAALVAGQMVRALVDHHAGHLEIAPIGDDDQLRAARVVPQPTTHWLLVHRQTNQGFIAPAQEAYKRIQQHMENVD